MSSKAQKLQDSLDALEKSLNILGGEKESEDAVTEWFRQLHRTTQQALVRNLILPVLHELDSDYKDGWIDSRNKAAATLAHKMLAAVNDDDTYLPLV